jgi:hypothetical protein
VSVGRGVSWAGPLGVSWAGRSVVSAECTMWVQVPTPPPAARDAPPPRSDCAAAWLPESRRCARRRRSEPCASTRVKRKRQHRVGRTLVPGRHRYRRCGRPRIVRLGCTYLDWRVSASARSCCSYAVCEARSRAQAHAPGPYLRNHVCWHGTHGSPHPPTRSPPGGVGAAVAERSHASLTSPGGYESVD